MKRIVRKVFYDYEKEEKFLNQMSNNGWALIKYSWCKYVFEASPKNEYLYRIELLEHPYNDPKSKDYIAFMEETGAKVITVFNNWVYFQRKSSDGPFDIYSDIDSRLLHYNRIFKFFKTFVFLNLFLGLLNLFLSLSIHKKINSINFYISLFSFTFVIIVFLFGVIPTYKKINKIKVIKSIRE